MDHVSKNYNTTPMTKRTKYAVIFLLWWSTSKLRMFPHHSFCVWLNRKKKNKNYKSMSEFKKFNSVEKKPFQFLSLVFIVSEHDKWRLSSRGKWFCVQPACQRAHFKWQSGVIVSAPAPQFWNTTGSACVPSLVRKPLFWTSFISEFRHIWDSWLTEC